MKRTVVTLLHRKHSHVSSLRSSRAKPTMRSFRATAAVRRSGHVIRILLSQYRKHYFRVAGQSSGLADSHRHPCASQPGWANLPARANPPNYVVTTSSPIETQTVTIVKRIVCKKKKKSRSGEVHYFERDKDNGHVSPLFAKAPCSCVSCSSCQTFNVKAGTAPTEGELGVVGTIGMSVVDGERAERD